MLAGPVPAAGVHAHTQVGEQRLLGTMVHLYRERSGFQLRNPEISLNIIKKFGPAVYLYGFSP